MYYLGCLTIVRRCYFIPSVLFLAIQECPRFSPRLNFFSSLRHLAHPSINFYRNFAVIFTSVAFDALWFRKEVLYMRAKTCIVLMPVIGLNHPQIFVGHSTQLWEIGNGISFPGKWSPGKLVELSETEPWSVWLCWNFVPVCWCILGSWRPQNCQNQFLVKFKTTDGIQNWKWLNRFHLTEIWFMGALLVSRGCRMVKIHLG